MWRGLPLTEGPAFQPEVSMSVADLTLSLWGNQVLNNEVHRGRFDEVDGGADYERTWGRWTASAGLAYYSYPHRSDIRDSGEASGRLAARTGPVELFTAHGADVFKYPRSYYGEAGASFTRDLAKGASWDATATLGWGSSRYHEVYLDLPKAGMGAATLSGALTWAAWGFEWRVGASLGRWLDRDLREAVGDATVFAASLGAAVEF